MKIALDVPEPLDVQIPAALLNRVPMSRRAALYGVLAQDPRPHYQNNPQRIYGFIFAGMEIRFTVEGKCLTVRDIHTPET